MLAYGLVLAAACVLGERAGVIEVGPLKAIPDLVHRSGNASSHTLAAGEGANGGGAGIAGGALDAPTRARPVSIDDRDLPPAAFQNAPRPKAPLEGLDDPSAAAAPRSTPPRPVAPR